MLLLRHRCWCCVVSQDAKAFTKSNQNVILVFATQGTVGGFPRGISWLFSLSIIPYHILLFNENENVVTFIVKSACENCSNERKIENWFYFRLINVLKNRTGAEKKLNICGLNSKWNGCKVVIREGGIGISAFVEFRAYIKLRAVFYK